MIKYILCVTVCTDHTKTYNNLLRLFFVRNVLSFTCKYILPPKAAPTQAEQLPFQHMN